LNLDREYFEVWIEHADGSMRRVAGDIDIVSVTDATGRMLDHTSAVNVAQQLGHGIEAQHPWSATFAIPHLRDEVLAAHRWHPDPALRGEPLLLYMNGQARVGWFEPTKKINPENPLESVLWLDGGAVDVDQVVRFQRDMRGTIDNPSDAAPPPGHKPASAQVRDALIDADLTGGNRLATCSITTQRIGGAVYRMGATLERRQDDGTYAPADLDAECDGGEIVVLPDTATMTDVAAGTTRIPIIDELLGEDWRDLFR